MEKLIETIRDNQSYLMKRILHYAKLHNYVEYTSTLEEAWAVSVSGLSEALISCIRDEKQVPEFHVSQDVADDPKLRFGVEEARRHRQRGVTLEMFLGLMKYYRQSFLDLTREQIANQELQDLYVLWVNRFFDQNEIAFCMEWVALPKEGLLPELQAANRALSNEKNLYLTIFESIPLPVMLFDVDGYCSNINFAAQQLIQDRLHLPGHVYYNDMLGTMTAGRILPWIKEEFHAFMKSEELEASIEKDFTSPSQGTRNLNIKFHRMLDVSGKFTGTVIIISDQTEFRQVEDQLRHLGFRDTLTGLYNRRYFDREVARLSTGRFNPAGIVSCDVDGLKLVNDNLGHQAGDNLLQIIAYILQSCFGGSDVVCRVGGDEFIVLMPFGNDAAIRSACRNADDMLAEYNNMNRMPVSVSIGWIKGNIHMASDIITLMKEADTRMYAEKKRNHTRYVSLFLDRFRKYGSTLYGGVGGAAPAVPPLRHYS